MPSGRQAAGALLARLRLLASGSRGLATCSGTTVASQGRLAVCEQAEAAAARQGLARPASVQRRGVRIQSSRWTQVGSCLTSAAPAAPACADVVDRAAAPPLRSLLASRIAGTRAPPAGVQTATAAAQTLSQPSPSFAPVPPSPLRPLHVSKERLSLKGQVGAAVRCVLLLACRCMLGHVDGPWAMLQPAAAASAMLHAAWGSQFLFSRRLRGAASSVPLPCLTHLQVIFEASWKKIEEKYKEVRCPLCFAAPGRRTRRCWLARRSRADVGASRCAACMQRAGFHRTPVRHA